MQGAELMQIRGIGDTTSERLTRDYGIETLADLARLSDTEVDELQEALRATSSRVKSGDIARWRGQARQLVREREAVPDEPLATFVVEALKPAAGPGDRPRFVLHHVEGDQTLETSEPKPAMEDAVRWMQERVTMTAAPLRKELPAEHPDVVHPAGPGLAAVRGEPSSRRGRLLVTALEVQKARSPGINGVTSLLAEAPVVVEGGSALVFVGQVSLEGTDGPLTCQMRCRLHRIESGQEVTFTWAGELTPASGTRTATISSTPVSIPSGAYRGVFFAEDLGRTARRAFCELPLLVVD